MKKVARKSNDSDGANDSSSSSDESDCDEHPQFKVGDAVNIYWSMLEPADWFTGEVVKCSSRGIKVFYPESDDWQWHDPAKWDVEHVP